MSFAMNGFDDLMTLIRLVDDPKAHKARLQELHAAIEQAALREAEANAAEAALEAEKSRLTKLEKAVREREVTVHIAENQIASDLEELQKWKRESRESRLITVGPGGLTKERDDTPNAPDPISDRFSEPMGKPGAANVRRTSQRARA
jgi:hypothetical protein